jgi:hypothetical protein
MTARSKKKDTETPEPPASKGWVKPKTAIRLVALVSILLAVWTTYNLWAYMGPAQSILWGLISAAGIWLISGLTYLVTKGSRRS